MNKKAPKKKYDYDKVFKSIFHRQLNKAYIKGMGFGSIDSSSRHSCTKLNDLLKS